MSIHLHSSALLLAVTFCGACAPSLHAQLGTHLLNLEQTSLDVKAGSALANEELLRDGNEQTATPIRVEAGQQLNLVYSFGEQTVTIGDVSILTNGLAANRATLEIFASTVSPTTSFRSLKAERLRASQARIRQYFRFEPAGAKWVIIRVTPLDKTKPLSFSMAELYLNGYVGVPEAAYLFKESPADAIQVLNRLSDSLKVEITDDEEKLFADARDGKLDEFTFAEASLISSGVTDTERRKKLLTQIDQFESQCKERIAESLMPFERGQKLLDWLHTGSFRNGYSALQTDVAIVLEKQTFNCVSSATLYNILARRLGLDARGIEVPDHAFAIVYDGTKHVDVETTNRLGFNPARNRQALEQLKETTGFVYMPERNRDKRREIGDAGMVALTYYNHGVTAREAGRHNEAMVGFFKALSLDKGNHSAVKNVLAVLANWSLKLYENGEKEKAFAVLEVGRELAPKDRTLEHNQEVLWQRQVKTLVDADQADEALKQLREVYERTQVAKLAELQSRVFVLQSEKLQKAKQWKAALAMLDEGLKSVDARARKELLQTKQYVVFGWSSDLLNGKKFAEAVDVVEICLKDDPDDHDLGQRLTYIGQEWARQEIDAQGFESGLQRIQAITKRFPKNFRDDLIINALTNEQAKEFINAKNYERAIKIYETALTLFPDDHDLGQRHTYIGQEWARQEIDAQGFEAGLQKIQAITKRFPKSFRDDLVVNALTAEQAKEFTKAKNYEPAIKIYETARKLFPDVYDIGRQEENLWRLLAKPHVDAREWQKALDIYTRARTKVPKPSAFRRNLAFIAQELGSDTFKEKGLVAGEQAIANMAKRFPDNDNIQKQRGSLVNREVLRLTKVKQFDDAEQLLKKHREFWRYKSDLDDAATYLYYQQAKPLLNAKEWGKAIEVFAKGCEAFPKNRDLELNMEFAWIQKANPLIEEKKWEEAIAVYRKALVALPSSSDLKNNLRYCEQELKKVTKDSK